MRLVIAARFDSHFRSGPMSWMSTGAGTPKLDLTHDIRRLKEELREFAARPAQRPVSTRGLCSRHNQDFGIGLADHAGIAVRHVNHALKRPMLSAPWRDLRWGRRKYRRRRLPAVSSTRPARARMEADQPGIHRRKIPPEHRASGAEATQNTRNNAMNIKACSRQKPRALR